jgi:MoaA/NifB/PqqE/SkfB family radical SAM enzyme
MKNNKISDLDLYRKGYMVFHVMPILNCNLFCKYCYVGERRKEKKSLSLSQLRIIRDKIEALSFPKIFYEISGGEIFLRKDWLQIFSLFLKTGHFVSINTNGTLVTEKIAETLAKLYQEYKDKIFFSVSLDSHKSVIHNKTRGNFKESLMGAELLKKYKIPFRVAITISRHNSKHIIQTVKYVVNHLSRGFSLGTLKPCFPITRESAKLFITKKEILRIHRKILNFKKKMDFEYYHCLGENNESFCTAGIDRVAITPDGCVFSCYALINSKKSYGNILKDDFVAILNRIMRRNKKRDKKILLCEHCEKKWGNPPVRLGK